MSLVTKKLVLETVENMVNEGRETPVEITGNNSPYQVLQNMTNDDLGRLDILGLYRGISANEYSVKASLLWTSLFWKIGEQILIVGNYQSPFSRYYTELNVGADIEEVAPRIKEGIDRNTLSNSALFTNFVTQYDSFYHRINQFKVWATTYDRTEIERISNSWDNIANMLNAELQNILLSSNVYIHDLSKEALVSQYLAGGMDYVEIPAITSEFTAMQCAVQINTIMDTMQLEANQSYIPFNRNVLNPDPTIRDIVTSPLVFIPKAELLNNIHFMTALNTYFGKEWQNDKFAGNVIKIPEFPNTISSRINVTPGYTPVTGSPKILGFILEENGFIFKQKAIGTFNFDNAATLKTSVFNHLDAMANISDRRKCVALIQK